MALVLKADQFGYGSILLQESKIERCRKSRESGFLDISTAAIPVAPMRRSVVIFVQNNEVPHIASYETHQRSEEISIAMTGHRADDTGGPISPGACEDAS